ncbi:unnamed protein product [Effrenium voratum]|nr:unnamed protein product [Effrenium voratum]
MSCARARACATLHVYSVLWSSFFKEVAALIKQESLLIHDYQDDPDAVLAPAGVELVADHSPMCVEMNIIVAVEMSTVPFKTFKFDGILGLSLDGLAMNKNFSTFDMQRPQASKAPVDLRGSQQGRFQASRLGAMARAVLAVVGAALALVLQGCFPIKKLHNQNNQNQPYTEGYGPTHGPAPPPQVAKCSSLGSHSRHMDCGKDVEVCGVLTLETGEGSGNYKHPEPVVHGLWPQTDGYGTSECDDPDSARDPSKIYPCFDTQGSQNSAMWFQKHEWQKHGTCAGVQDADDFFRQVCQLSNGPLQVMSGARAAGKDLTAMAEDLQNAGFCVFHIDSSPNSQLQLSACLDVKGQWRLADVRSFPTVCGEAGSSGGGGSSSSSSSSSSSGSCVSGQRGPSCTRDSDCWSASGCQRCAHSGYCTDVPLRSLTSLRNIASLFEMEGPKEVAARSSFWVLLIVSAGLSACWALRLWRRSEGVSVSPLMEAEE